MGPSETLFGRWATLDTPPSEPGPTYHGLEAFLEAYTDWYRFYSAGKAALADALRAMLRTRTDLGAGTKNVVLPAYVPDAVVEPMRELGLEARYYAIEPTLAPDRSDLERLVDERTIALVTINYFGFAPSGLDDVAAIADEAGCYHVDDNAHAPFSVHEDKLLGTVGDAGITSLWKALPIPNGAVLYLSNERLRRAYEPSPFAGVRSNFDTGDARFVCKTVLEDLVDANQLLRESVDAVVSNVVDDTPPSPGQRYESGKRRMSKLASLYCLGIDPTRIRRRRRERYRAWVSALSSDDVRPLFPTLPDGTCPQSVPVYAESPAAFRRALSRLGLDGVHTWPRLPRDVSVSSRHETARRYATHVFALPVATDVDTNQIRQIGRELATARE